MIDEDTSHGSGIGYEIRSGGWHRELHDPAVVPGHSLQEAQGISPDLPQTEEHLGTTRTRCGSSRPQVCAIRDALP